MVSRWQMVFVRLVVLAISISLSGGLYLLYSNRKIDEPADPAQPRREDPADIPPTEPEPVEHAEPAPELTQVEPEGGEEPEPIAETVEPEPLDPLGTDPDEPMVEIAVTEGSEANDQADVADLSHDVEAVDITPDVAADGVAVAEHEPSEPPEPEPGEEKEPTEAAQADDLSEAETPTGPPPIETTRVLTAKASPFQVMAPPGWREVSGRADLSLSLEDAVDVDFFGLNPGEGERSARKHAQADVRRVLARHPAFRLTDQQLVELAGESWGRFDFVSTAADAPGAIILLTHAGPRGAFSIVVHGRGNALVERNEALQRVIGSFAFPDQ